MLKEMREICYVIYINEHKISNVKKFIYSTNKLGIKTVSLITTWTFRDDEVIQLSRNELFDLFVDGYYILNGNRKYILFTNEEFRTLFSQTPDEEISIEALKNFSKKNIEFRINSRQNLKKEMQVAYKGETEKEESEENDFSYKSRSLPPISHMVKSIGDYVIGQDDTIKKCVLAIYNNQELLNGHYTSSEVATLKNNILMSGPSGVGKTEIARQLATHFDVPIFCDDITQYSGTGWKGKELVELLKGLYVASGKDIKLAQRGILVLDEIDKISANPFNLQSSHNTLDVQRGLLKIIEGGKFELDGYNYRNIHDYFDTSNLTIIGMGSFNNFRRGEDTPSSELRYFTKSDYIEYGLIPEFVGRFKTFATLHNLTFEDKKRILLESQLSILRLKLRQLTDRKIQVTIINGLDKLCEAIVEKSEEMDADCGARNLNDITYNIFSEIDYLLYDHKNPKEIIFSDDIVKYPSRVYIK